MDRYVANLFVRPPTPQFLDFGGGFWGFWILDLGDFGFLSLGFWIFDFGFSDKFWILHKKKKTVHADPARRICTLRYWPCSLRERQRLLGGLY